MKDAESAQLIRDLLDRVEWTQEEAAHRVGVSARTMRYWVSGRRRVRKVALIALFSAAGIPTPREVLK